MDLHNPYEPSQSSLTPQAPPGESGFLAEPRTLPIGAGFDWLSGGWNFFVLAPGVWIGFFLLWIVLLVAVSILPLIGGFMGTILGVVLSAGVALGCQAQSRGEPLEISHLFAGFSTNFNQLLLVGLVYVGASVVITVLMVMVMLLGLGGMAAFAANQSPQPFGLIAMGVGFVVVALLFIPVVMSAWFSPLLVVFENIPALDAMKLSLRACLRNFWVIVVYGLVTMVASLIAAIPLFLGFLVLAPVLMATTYVAYRQLFYQD